MFRRPRTTRRRAGSPTVFREATTPIARSWKAAAGGLALAGAAMVGATFALMNRAPDLPKRELAAVATEGPVRPQSGGQTVEPSSSAGPLTQDSRPTEPSQVGASETRPDAVTAPAPSSSLPAGGEAVADAPPQPASLGLESVAPAFTPAPANPAPAPARNGARAGSPATRHPGRARRLQRRRPPPLRPVRRFRLRRRSRTPTQQPQRLCRPRLLSHRRRRSIQRENLPGNRPCKGQPRVRKPQQRQSLTAERRPPQPAPSNGAQSPPPAAQGVGNPTPVATPAPPSIQQRFADGVTGAFSYVVHLPGALLPHSADPNADANRSGPQ